MTKSSNSSIEYLKEYQTREWEGRSGISRNVLDHRNNLNTQLREAEESKREQKPKTSIASTFSKAFEERDRTR
jgi:hypothetical protein|tara:strand:+ start:209 stop:427 length:219 start_codon:yes stop_codon:yes gene_type:complete